jgi:hypothetical protein
VGIVTPLDPSGNVIRPRRAVCAVAIHNQRANPVLYSVSEKFIARAPLFLKHLHCRLSRWDSVTAVTDTRRGLCHVTESAEMGGSRPVVGSRRSGRASGMKAH